jgi:hypothetical protein
VSDKLDDRFHEIDQLAFPAWTGEIDVSSVADMIRAGHRTAATRFALHFISRHINHRIALFEWIIVASKRIMYGNVGIVVQDPRTGIDTSLR